MIRVNDKEWEIEVNGFQVGHQFGSLRRAFQKNNWPPDGAMEAGGALCNAKKS